MTYFKNKYQMIKATDDEFREFFATTIFEGVFSHEIRSIHTDKFKGHNVWGEASGMSCGNT